MSRLNYKTPDIWYIDAYLESGDKALRLKFNEQFAFGERPTIDRLDALAILADNDIAREDVAEFIIDAGDAPLKLVIDCYGIVAGSHVENRTKKFAL